MTNTPISFSFAEPSDLTDLSRLMLEANRHYWGDAEGAAAMTAASAKALITGDSGCTAVIARVGTVSQGFATISILHAAPNEHGTLFLKDLFVSQNARGTGLGSEFMRHLAKMAVEKGCERFDWTAESDNPEAIRFYEALGANRVTEKVYFRFHSTNLRAFAEG